MIDLLAIIQQSKHYPSRIKSIVLIVFFLLFSCTEETSRPQFQALDALIKEADSHPFDQNQAHDIQLDQSQVMIDQRQVTDLDAVDQALDLGLYDPQSADWWISREENQLLIPAEQLKAQALWAKVVALKTAVTKEEASAMGCALKGRLQGSGLNNLQALSGLDFNFLVRGSVNTKSALNFGLALYGLDLSRSLRTQEGLTMKAGQFDWDMNRIPFFNDQILEWSEQSIVEGWLESPPSTMHLPIRLTGAPAFDIELFMAQITGEFVVEVTRTNELVKLKNGVLMGYIDKTALMSMVEQIKQQCTAMQPPALCSLFGSQIDQPAEDLANIAVTFLGDWEVSYDRNTGIVADCEVGSCNAISFCLGIELQVF